MTVWAVAVAADRNSGALRKPGQRFDRLSRVGAFHLPAVTAQVCVPDLWVFQVMTAGPLDQFPAWCDGGQPHIHDILGGISGFPHAANRIAGAAEPQPLATPPLVAIGVCRELQAGAGFPIAWPTTWTQVGHGKSLVTRAHVVQHHLEIRRHVWRVTLIADRHGIPAPHTRRRQTFC